MSQTATAISVIQENFLLSNVAIAYGLKELARRAGVSKEFFDFWRIEFDESGTVIVTVDPGGRKEIRFPRAPGDFKAYLTSGIFQISTATWMNCHLSLSAQVPDFKIPFSSSGEAVIGPLFTKVNEDRVDCSVDLLSSIVLTLTRFEETCLGPRDEHGRFTAFSSIAWRSNFLHRPIVDEYGLAMEEALTALLPGWQAHKRTFQVNLGHDVDEIGVPFSIKSCVAHTLRRGKPTASARDLAAQLTGTDTAYQRFLRQIVTFGLERGFRPATYWKASNPGPHDTGYDLRHKKISALISSFRLADLELGIHLSYGTFDSPGQFRSEVSFLQELLGERHLGGRQDFLRWNPRTWVLWDSMNLAYDASVGYADQIGFRAGTSYPFHPWLLSESRQANILEVPLLAMDSTLYGYMKLSPEQAFSKLMDCVARCKTVGGIFTTVWHNTTMMRPAYVETYRKLLDALQGCETYNWRNSLDGYHWV